jgi:hypothetical protein
LWANPLKVWLTYRLKKKKKIKSIGELVGMNGSALSPIPLIEPIQITINNNIATRRPTNREKRGRVSFKLAE